MIKQIFTSLLIVSLFSGCIYRERYIVQESESYYDDSSGYYCEPRDSYREREFIYVDSGEPASDKARDNLFFATIFYIVLSIFNSGE